MEDLEELITDLRERVEKLENDRRVSGIIMGVLVAGVIYLLFF